MNARILPGQFLPRPCAETASCRRPCNAIGALFFASLASSSSAQQNNGHGTRSATAPIHGSSVAHPGAPENQKTRTPQQKHPPQAHPHPPQSALSQARPGTSTPLTHTPKPIEH